MTVGDCELLPNDTVINYTPESPVPTMQHAQSANALPLTQRLAKEIKASLADTHTHTHTHPATDALTLLTRATSQW